jgi:dolichyl-phosphate-mannose--protein O-mannosyl transferase
MLLSLYVFLESWFGPKEPGKLTLLGTGLCLGAAIATKLTAFSMVLMIYFLFVQKVISNGKHKRKLFADGLVFLFILPLLIYFAVYLSLLFFPGYGLKDIWDIQLFNFHYHFQVATTQKHGYSSAWWGWPLMLRPIWYYFNSQSGVIKGILCIGNPAVFWMVPAMTAFLCWEWIRQNFNASVGLILFGFLGQWLFYALSPRLTFFHYFYFAMPFVAMGLALICGRIWRTGKTGKILVSAYMLLVLGLFIYWYPLLTGLPISQGYYDNHIWTRAWI